MNSHDSHENNFYLQIAYALGACQMLEQQLKIYIKTTHSIIREKLQDSIPYKFDEENLERHTLGRLSKIFGRMSNNAAIIERLDKFVKLRNELAHTAISKSRDYEDGLFYPESQKTLEMLEKINQEASMLRSAVYTEGNEIYCMHVFS